LSPAPETPRIPFEVPAGWYDDPRGVQQYRYWDGVGWTDHVVPAPAGGAPAVAAPSGGRRQRSRAWVAALLVLLAFLVALVLIEDAGEEELKETAAVVAT
jgi:hypothetical protein